MLITLLKGKLLTVLYNLKKERKKEKGKKKNENIAMCTQTLRYVLGGAWFTGYRVRTIERARVVWVWQGCVYHARLKWCNAEVLERCQDGVV